jgi:peroxiredoxin
VKLPVAKFKLPFTLLADEDKKIVEAYPNPCRRTGVAPVSDFE